MYNVFTATKKDLRVGRNYKEYINMSAYTLVTHMYTQYAYVWVGKNNSENQVALLENGITPIVWIVNEVN